MRVVLINPSSPFMIDQAVMPPLGLWYVANALQAHNVTVVDLGLGDTIPEGADAYGVTGCSVHLNQMAEILPQLSGLKVAGGPHATAKPEELLEMGFDTVVQGEGDSVISQIVERGITGIITAPRIRDLDHHFPNRNQEYRYHYQIDGLKTTTMVTSRGCPWECAFCSKDVYGRVRVTRSADSVMTEVDSVMRQGYQAVMFYDDTFMTGRERLETLCYKFHDRNLVWRCLARADDADKGILNLMKASGCREIALGVESGSQTILDNIHKHETVEQQRRCIQLAHEVGLRVKAFMIVGLPGESQETIAETDKFLEESRPDAVDVNILAVYPGSAIYKNPEAYDVKFGPYHHCKGRSDAYVCTTSTSNMTSEEILRAQEMLYTKYARRNA